MDMHHIIEVRYLFGYVLMMAFDDGALKIYDFESSLWGEMTQPLKDVDFFKKVEIDHGALKWPNGADFCPNSLYEQAVPIEKIYKSWKGAA